jgi:hypothetical protein
MRKPNNATDSVMRTVKARTTLKERFAPDDMDTSA